MLVQRYQGRCTPLCLRRILSMLLYGSRPAVAPPHASVVSATAAQSSVQVMCPDSPLLLQRVGPRRDVAGPATLLECKPRLRRSPSREL
jgi:hypothetical protein